MSLQSLKESEEVERPEGKLLAGSRKKKAPNVLFQDPGREWLVSLVGFLSRILGTILESNLLNNKRLLCELGLGVLCVVWEDRGVGMSARNLGLLGSKGVL